MPICPVFLHVSLYVSLLQVHLQSLLALPAVREVLAKHQDVLANLDQNPLVQEHFGAQLPVLMASLGVMWSVMRNRPLTPLELRLQDLTL